MNPIEIITALIKVHKKERYGTQKEYNVRLQIEIAIVIFNSELEFLKSINHWKGLQTIALKSKRITELNEAIKLGKKEV